MKQLSKVFVYGLVASMSISLGMDIYSKLKERYFNQCDDNQFE